MTALLITAHTLDLLTYGIAVMVLPPGYEANPLARAAYVAAGLPGVAGLKMTVLWLGLAIWGRLGDRREWTWFGHTLGCVPVALGLFGLAGNLVALWLWA